MIEHERGRDMECRRGGQWESLTPSKDKVSELSKVVVR